MTSDPVLSIEADPTVTQHVCDHCERPFQRVRGYLYRDGDAHAVFIASCHHHDGHEAFIDAVFSPTWEEGVDDRVTFGCRVGPVDGQPDPGAGLTTGAAAFTDTQWFGRKLTREEALGHPLLHEFWAVVDHVLVHDPVVRHHVYGPEAEFA
ncbi:hypothetical protein SFC79_17750 [Nocardioides sp. S-58]|uniref:Uncharacterized protein n=1 Tax=Nocardioides renjunii TaxID=3095075 RepID=A0ABU5KGP6_9ACTN|nr:hypothetical protein [Nocardioides sp. S-58]MDZ5663624.1 hypothetical protein [Nocardioides sp. S-58]